MFLILVVLYKKSLKESSTLMGLLHSSSILNNTGASVCLWDNTPEPMSDTDLSSLKMSLNSFLYKHCTNNAYLSKVYNYAITDLLTKSGKDFLVLLDDDSDIKTSYFENLIESINSNPEISLFVPQVYNNDIIKSPSKCFWGIGKDFKKLEAGLMQTKNRTAINSGMTISKSFFQSTNFRYLEKLKNYGTDNYLFQQLQKTEQRFFVLNYKMEHSLSFFDSDDIRKKANSFRAIKKASLVVYKYNLVLRLYWIFASIRYALKYKSRQFFKL